jgi:hypothetical protein
MGVPDFAKLQFYLLLILLGLGSLAIWSKYAGVKDVAPDCNTVTLRPSCMKVCAQEELACVAGALISASCGEKHIACLRNCDTIDCKGNVVMRGLGS